MFPVRYELNSYIIILLIPEIMLFILDFHGG
jgi:hypothetical protein